MLVIFWYLLARRAAACVLESCLALLHLGGSGESQLPDVLQSRGSKVLNFTLDLLDFAAFCEKLYGNHLIKLVHVLFILLQQNHNGEKMGITSWLRIYTAIFLRCPNYCIEAVFFMCKLTDVSRSRWAVPTACQSLADIASLIIGCLIPCWCGLMFWIFCFLGVAAPLQGILQQAFIFSLIFCGVSYIGIIGAALAKGLGADLEIRDAGMICILLGFWSGVALRGGREVVWCRELALLTRTFLGALCVRSGVTTWNLDATWVQKAFDSTLGFPGEGPPKKHVVEQRIEDAELTLLVDLAFARKSFVQVRRDAQTFSYRGTELQRLVKTMLPGASLGEFKSSPASPRIH